jgi:four helix bundle protein
VPASRNQELTVWQASMEMVVEVYRLTPAFPKQEAYGLTSQIQRAAVSVASNLSEGHARDSTREFLHHVSIALGSLAELETQLLLAERLEYLRGADLKLMLSKGEQVGKMLRGLQKSLKAKL